VVRQDRLPHPNPYGCEDGDCTNRATLRLTLDTGQQLNLCRPHAAQYPAPITSATADRTVPAAQDLADISPADQPRPDATPAPTPSTMEAPVSPAVTTFRPTGQEDLAPSGAVARVRANLAALRTLHAITSAARPASAAEQAVLARWSGWGAVPEVFDDDRDEFAWARTELRELLPDAEYAAAARSTLNAHYTDAALVRAIWAGVTRLGFTGGNVLEPGVGSGNFLAFAPEGARLVGVELEPVTAAVAAALYPQAQILTESFADTRAPEGSFDLVIGDVPFGKVVLNDRRHNAGRHSIHNHFLIKSLHLTRPGGLVAVLTSRYTMDAANPAARREMAALADLVGAVRLPSGALDRAAGTRAIYDLLVLHRREPDRDPTGRHWEVTSMLDVRDGQARVNTYFAEHPEHVLGDLAVAGGLYGPDELIVTGDRDAAPALAAALEQIADQAHEAGLTMDTTRVPITPRPVALVGQAAGRPDGYLAATPGGDFTRVEDGQVVPYRPPASQAAELRALLRLRDIEVALLEAEAASIDDTDDIVRMGEQLNTAYDAYVRQYGPINRFSWRRTGRTDPETGEERVARIRPPQGGFRTDPYATAVFALEHFDSTHQTATKADIFRQRVIAPRAPRLGADTPADALAICLDQHGEVRLDEVARLLGIPVDQARAALGTLVFDDPEAGRCVPAPEYLSGNVRVKLTQAQAAAAEDSRFAVNVTALTEVIPRDLAPDEIEARLGAAWISAPYVAQFLRETLDDPSLVVEHPGGSTWTVKSDRRRSVLATSRWGTERYPAPDVAQALLEQRQIRIYDVDADGTRYFNPGETVAAQEKATELAERFSEWVWADPQRATVLAGEYNTRFNAVVLRSYDKVPLSLPGLTVSFQPRPHQLAAVARIISEPSVGLFHEVGAGKTAEMVIGAMELRRLGLVSKPAIVVPNHMLEQFGREFLQLYPQAKLLAAQREDLERERRRTFVARCATGDWDAVIMTRSAFERIQMSPQVQRAYLNRELKAIDAQLDHAKAEGQRFSVKRLERMKLQTEERIKNKLDGVKDPGITFEQTGIDYLFADEAHAYKNLRTPSNIPNMSVDGSQRASDLDMKIAYLRERYDRVATLATATPIANSMGEAYTMQRYLRPDLFTDAGITDFDTWAATFGQTTTAIEVAPDGGGMRMQTRFAKFVNVPELLRMWHVTADIKTAEDLNLPTPPLAPRPSDGQRLPETVVVAPSEQLKEYVDELAERAEMVRAKAVDPTTDNMLKISSDGRAAALDLRLVGRRTDEPQKLDVAAATIAGIWEQHRDRVYPGPDGDPHPTAGALQIVFADLGTPRPGAWSVYDQLRQQLATLGVPREQIRFIHEARNDREKGELFAACRDGRVSVLIGSTERMGVGTNVQARAVALHHLDCPWRPADLQQRDGRIARQGNLNDEIRILRYVTEGSFDGYLWQTVQRKAQFIAQVMRGRLDVREIEDIGDSALSYSEVKALATGNPLLLDQAQAQAEVTRLERLERAHHRSHDSLRWTVRETEKRIQYLTARAEAAQAAIGRRVDTHGDKFAITLDGHRFVERPPASDHLRAVLDAQMHNRQPNGSVTDIGEIGGFTITSTLHRDHKGVVTLTVALTDVPASEVTLSAIEVAGAALITRLENKLTGLETVHSHARTDIGRLSAEAEQARTQLAEPFRQHEQLTAARTRLDDINAQIDNTRSDAPSTPPPAQPELPTDPPPADPDDQDQAAMAAHEAPSTAAAPRPAATALEDRRSAGDVHAETPRSTPLADDAVRERLGELVQRFYEARWYGTAVQARRAATDFQTVLRDHAPHLTVPGDQVEVGDFVRAVGINFHTGEPASASGIVVDNQHTSRRVGDDADEPTEWGQWMKVQPPQRAGTDAPMYEVYVRDERVLRLPAPIDRGRPDWIEADTQPAAEPRPTPAPNPGTTAAPQPSEPEAQATSSVRRALGIWLSQQPFTAAIPAEHHQWLADRIARLASDPRIRQTARVNSEDNFGLVFTTAMEDDLVEAVTAEPDNPAALLYFRDEGFASAFVGHARQVTYRATHGEENQESVTPPAETSQSEVRAAASRRSALAGAGDAVPVGTPPTPRTAAQLARLDAAPGTVQPAATPVNRGAYQGSISQPTAGPRSRP
jgi:N12 class adenine-specific DNA methylase